MDIKEICKLHKKTMTEVANAIGTTRNNLGITMRGNPTLTTIIKVANAIGITPQQLVSYLISNPMEKIKEIKGDEFNVHQGSFTWLDENDNAHTVMGELYYNKNKKRFEHTLEDENGNDIALIYWEYDL
jgi:transcriptional regulator with XRE-family HTH domain